MNEWVMVRREEGAIYTHRQNLTVQICVRSSDTDHRNFQLYCKTLFTAQSTRLTRLSSKLPATAGTSGSLDFRLPLGVSTDKRVGRLSPKAPGLSAEVRTSDSQEFQLMSGLLTTKSPQTISKYS